MTQEEINRLRSCLRKDVNGLLRYCGAIVSGSAVAAHGSAINAKLQKVKELLSEVEKLIE